VNVNWSVNGVTQTPVLYTTLMDTIGGLGANHANVTLGSFTFLPGNSTIKAWTSLPNNQPDTFNINDTISVTMYLGTPFSGTYTIGGANADFASFKDAINTMYHFGVAGPVIFNVNPGTYTEQLTFTGDPSGSSTTSTITFQSATGDSTSVTLQFSATGVTNNWVVRFNGASNITFKQMTIEATGPSNSRVFEMLTGSKRITITNCIVKTDITATSLTSACIFSGSDNVGVDYLTVTNNVLIGGYFSIHWYGSSTNKKNHVVIENNTITDYYYHGVQCFYADSVFIRYNSITSRTNSYIAYGIYVYYNAGASEIIGNKVHLQGTNTQYGISSGYKLFGNTTPLLIANNFVAQTGLSGVVYGIYLFNTNHVNVYHNSVSIGNGSTTTGRGFHASGGSDLKIINNSLANFGGGYAIYTNSTTNIVTCNYNNLFTSGVNLGYWGTSNHATLSAWQTASLKDGNSVSTDPEYTSSTDLHTLSFGLWQAGTMLAVVPIDIDKEPRNFFAPCIGADEYMLYYNDAGVLKMTEPVVVCAGIANVKLKIKNFGIQAFTGVAVNWTVNGIPQNPFTLTSTLAPGADQEVTIGTYNFVSGVLYDMVFYTTGPGSVADQNPLNDTLKVLGFQTSLSGIYTVGSAPTDNFSTIAEVLTILKIYGVCGPVTINVAANSGPFAGGLNFEGVFGTSAVNTITFNGNGNVINETALKYIMRFSNNSYITIDSFQLVVSNSHNTRYGVLMRSGSNNLTFNNNVINMGTTSAANTSAGIVSTGSETSATTAGNNAQYIAITNNTIIGGYYGITLMGTASYHNNYGHVISNNVIRDFYQYGIYTENADSSIIIGNNICRNNRPTFSTFYGIYASTSRNMKYIGNQVHSSGIGSYSAYPIYITTSANSLGFETEFINNAVYNITTTGTLYGMYFLGTNSNINFFHNTVHLVSSGTDMQRAVFFSTAPNNFKLYNNIFSVTGTGTGTKHCVYVTTTTATMVSNYNNFYISAPGTNYIGYWGAQQPTLASWQTATSKDANSLAVNPDFPANDDFTTKVPPLWQSGSPIPGVTHDIFGKPRNLLNPCRGAVEYDLFPYDIGVIAITGLIGECPGLLSIKVIVKNYGTTAISSVVVEWSVNGIAQTPVSLTGLSIISGGSQELTIGSYNFLQNVIYDLVVSTSMPNGMTDQNPGNDTNSLYGFMASMTGTYTVGNSPTDNFNSIQDAVNLLNQFGVCGPVVINVDPNSGPYTGGIELGAIDGISSLNTVTFNGNGSVINETASTYILAFNGTSYVTVNNFKIINTTPANNKFGIMVRGGSQHLQFTNNFIDVGTTSTSALTAGIAVSNSTTSAISEGNNGQHISILNNEIVGGYYGITLIGQTSYLNCYSNIVSNNIVRDFNSYGIYLKNCEATEVSGNNIDRATRPGVLAFYGIYALICRNIKYIGNRVHSSGVGTYTCFPFYISTSVNLPGYETELINNAVYGLPTTGTVFAFYLVDARDHLKLFNNTIHATTHSANTVYGVYFSGAPHNHSFKNNIVSINGTGTGTKYCIYSSATSTTFTSDNNVFHMGATGGSANYTGYWNDTICSNLTSWQTLTLKDLNSSDLNPIFASALTGNITPLSGGIDNMGTPVGVLTDLNNAPRSLVTPDVGAIEFTGIGFDIAISGGSLANGICLSINDSVYITIANVIGGAINFATNPLTIYWSVTGPVNSIGTMVLNSGTIASAGSLTVGETGVNMSVPGVYTLSAYIGANSANLFQGNDTLQNMASLEVFNPFYIKPKNVFISDSTQEVNIIAKSLFFPPGAFYFSEVCYYKFSVGAPLGGWPTYLIADDYVEITGVPNSHLGGYVLEAWNTSALMNTFTFPTGTFIGPNGTAVVAIGQPGGSVPSPANYYYHADVSFTYNSLNTSGHVLKDGSGNIVDAVGYGNFTFPPVANVPASEWSNPNPTSPGSTSGIRLFAPDNNTGSTWVVTSATYRQDPNTVNAGTTVPVPGTPTGFTWSHNGVVFATNVIDTTVGPWATSGVYPYVASYVTPCGVLTDTVAVFVSLIAGISDTTICAGDSTMLQIWMAGSGPWTLVVTDGSGTDTVSGITSSPWSTYVSPSTTTVYSVLSYQEGTGPFIPADLNCTITVMPPPVVSLAPFSQMCLYDAPITLSGGLPAGGSFSGTGVSASVFDPAVAGAGTHTVTYTFLDTTGCYGSDVQQILVGAPPIYTLTANHDICEGDATNLVVNHPGAAWSTGATTPLITVSPVVTTTYTVTITDSLTNCISFDSVVVTVNPVPTASISGALDTICVNHSITLDAGSGFASYAWPTGATTQTIVVDGATIGHGNTVAFTVTVTNTFGCEDDATVYITADDCIGISDPEAGSALTFWPNPNHGTFFVRITGITGEAILIISNVAGQAISNEKLFLDREMVKEINLGNIAPGIYIVRLLSKSTVITKQIVIR
jgi:hypothetical protein